MLIPRVVGVAVAAAVMLLPVGCSSHGVKQVHVAIPESWPARGNLASNSAFVTAAMRKLPGPSMPADLKRLRVVFAGDVPGGRLLLVTAIDPSTRNSMVGAYIGSPGVRGDELGWSQEFQLSEVDRPHKTTVVTDYWLSARGPSPVIAVAAPNDRVSILLQRANGYELAPGGSTGDGFAIADARSVDSPDTQIRVRVTDRSGHVVYDGPPYNGTNSGDALQLPAAVARMRDQINPDFYFGTANRRRFPNR